MLNNDPLKETKKDKRKDRHFNWQQKFSNPKISASARKRRNRKARENLKVNVSSIGEVLPEIDLDISVANSRLKPVIKDSLSSKQTKSSMKRNTVEEIERFQAILKHPSFVSNPLETVREHLGNSLDSR